MGAFLDIAEPNVLWRAMRPGSGHPRTRSKRAAIQREDSSGMSSPTGSRGRKDGRPFRYRNKGNMAVVGKNFAILRVRPFAQQRPVTWQVWAALHVLALLRHQETGSASLTQWFWSISAGQRSSRLISEGPRSSAS